MLDPHNDKRRENLRYVAHCRAAPAPRLRSSTWLRAPPSAAAVSG
jgi:hypothetical protein